jgi:UDPglucose--hexose-1-phosphate uridylyltransferase
MIVPKRSVQRMQDLSVDEQRSGCQAMQQLLMRYDKLFGCSFPYSMGWQGNINEQLSKSSFKGAPTGKYLNDDNRHWQLHAVYLPPLLRSATVKKFMAGYELVCEPQRDLTPEQAAAQLRSITCP